MTKERTKKRKKRQTASSTRLSVQSWNVVCAHYQSACSVQVIPVQLMQFPCGTGGVRIVDGADEKAPGLDKPSQTQTQTPAGQDSSFATTAASSAKVKSEPRVLKSESQNATSPATANRNGPTNIEHSKAKHNGTSTSASMAITCDELLDEIVGTICAAAPAAHPSVLGQDAKERESLGLADAMTDSRFAADGAEFHAVGLDEWQWSERHSALMFLSLFRGLS